MAMKLAPKRLNFTPHLHRKLGSKRARLGKQRSLAVFIKEIMIAKKREVGGERRNWGGRRGASCPKFGVMNLSAACT